MGLPMSRSRATRAPRVLQNRVRKAQTGFSCASRARKFAQAPLRNAARAELTARLMSSWSPAATRARSLPVAGLWCRSGTGNGVEVTPVDEGLSAETERAGTLVPGLRLGYCVHDCSEPSEGRWGAGADDLTRLAPDVAEAMRQAGWRNNRLAGSSTRAAPPTVSSMRPRITTPPPRRGALSISSPVPRRPRIARAAPSAAGRGAAPPPPGAARLPDCPTHEIVALKKARGVALRSMVKTRRATSAHHPAPSSASSPRGSRGSAR